MNKDLHTNDTIHCCTGCGWIIFCNAVENVRNGEIPSMADVIEAMISQMTVIHWQCRTDSHIAKEAPGKLSIFCKVTEDSPPDHLHFYEL